MNDLLKMFGLLSGPFIPHGHCYLWKPELVSLHLVSDALIAAAYYSIPITLLYFVRERKDLPFNRIFLLFAAFIVSCGTTHLSAIWTLWYPTYWLSGTIKAFTALISVFTALELIPLVPLALALPSPAQLEAANKELNTQIQERLQAEENLRQSQNLLEQRVQERTAELALTNQQLQQEVLERQRTEAALRASEEVARAKAEELETIMETVPAAVWVASDPDCRTMTANRTAYELMRMPPGSITNQSPQNRQFQFPFKLYRDGQVIDYEHMPMQRAGKTGQAIEEEFEFAFGEDDVHSLYGKAVPLRDEQGNVRGVVGAFLDVTERKQAEAALRQSQEQLKRANERFRLAARAVRSLIYDWDIPNNWVERTEGLLHVLGFSLKEAEPTANWWRDRVHPEDLKHLDEMGATGFQSDYYANEYRVLNRDNQYTDVLDQGLIAERDAAGNPIRIVGSTINISDRKAAEAALRLSKERFRALFEDAPDAILIADQQGTFIDVNTNACRLLQYEAAELTGKQLMDLLPQEELPLLESVRVTLISGETHVGEWRLIDALGKLLPVEISAKILADGRWQLFVRDIRDRKAAEALIQISESKLRSFVEANVIGILFADIYGTIREANDELLKIIGYSRQDLEAGQLRWTDITPPEYLTQDAERIAEAQDKGACTPFEKEYIRKDGSRVPVLVGFSLVEPVRTEAVAFIIDLTERQQAEAERDRLLALEKAARAEAERANRIKDEFLAVLSHELRSPLNPILGWATLLQRRQVDEKTLGKALTTIERNIKLQLQLIDDLLDVSRILRGKLNLNLESVDFATVITAAIETVRLSAEAKGIEIQTHFARGTGQVRGDAGRLQQIVWNLLSNAVKFTPNGGQITIWLDQIGSEIQIQVQDTGKGISPSFLPHVFEYFRQEDGSTTRQFGGLGLGLAIVRYLAEMHGGTVSADSPGEGLGSVFTLRIPCTEQPDPVLSIESNLQPLSPLSLEGIRILIAEDEVDTREFITFMLEQTGAVVTAVASAPAALSALATSLPDILISDIGMPGMDGYMLLQTLRSQPPEQGGTLPAIALTAYAGELDHRRAFEAGFNIHVPKPVDSERLIELILRLVRPGGGAR
ncbi:MAG: PAS domain S-box protein [Cyanobacteria bacterium Co-bin13]|nr:PAS domain S-box protein [Cyanobacteria bacterium Co-bin13]